MLDAWCTGCPLYLVSVPWQFFLVLPFPSTISLIFNSHLCEVKVSVKRVNKTTEKTEKGKYWSKQKCVCFIRVKGFKVLQILNRQHIHTVLHHEVAFFRLAVHIRRRVSVRCSFYTDVKKHHLLQVKWGTDWFVAAVHVKGMVGFNKVGFGNVLIRSHCVTYSKWWWAQCGSRKPGNAAGKQTWCMLLPIFKSLLPASWYLGCWTSALLVCFDMFLQTWFKFLNVNSVMLTNHH